MWTINTPLYVSWCRFQSPAGVGALADLAYGLFLAHTDAAEKAYLDATSILTPLINQGTSTATISPLERESGNE